MNKSRRYTIFNLYIRGSNQSPQACHAMDVLYEKRDDGLMTEEAMDLLNSWRKESKVEIMLQGGYHEELEDLYTAISSIKDLPCAKFNESYEALNGACTVVTFVASDRIVLGNKFVRDNRLNPANVREGLELASHKSIGIESVLTIDEIFVISKIAFLSLAS